jgi:hypothetical protein
MIPALYSTGQEVPVEPATQIISLPDTTGTMILREDTLHAPIVPDTIKTASSIKKTDTEEHSPKKAALYSAVLPGLGQAYNKKYWKIPLVYGGFAAFGYFIDWNNNFYKTSKNAYRDLSDGDESTNSYLKLKQIKYYDLNNPTDVENLKRGLLRSQDYYRRNRDLLVILTIAFYGLNIIDASVDAHFFNWDISDDLTLNWQPTIDQMNNKNFLTLNCTIKF